MDGGWMSGWREEKGEKKRLWSRKELVYIAGSLSYNGLTVMPSPSLIQ